jgi:hypothetical protein
MTDVEAIPAEDPTILTAQIQELSTIQSADQLMARHPVA